MPEAERTPRAGARERLLGAADRLFYEEGVCSVGIDRVIAEAGVAKGSLYYVFGSKEELVRAYLEERSRAWREHLGAGLEACAADARARLLGVFEVLAEAIATPGFHGCPFIAASAEAPPGGVVESCTGAHRSWVRGLLTDLARAAGAPRPETLAAQLALVYDGAMVAADLDGDPAAAADAARRAAEALVDGALGAAPAP
jgi:AcrR family transcriptional regulator